MSENLSQQNAEAYVLPDGGEVQLTHRDDVVLADRIEILPGGWAKLIFKQKYQKEVYPPHKIEGIYSHTQTEEEADWW